MRSLVTEAWSDATFSSLEGITVTGSCRLRRIFTMKRQAPDTTDDDGNNDNDADDEIGPFTLICHLLDSLQC